MSRTTVNNGLTFVLLFKGIIIFSNQTPKLMDFSLFTQIFKQALPVGTILPNPGGGTSKILGYGDDSVTYQRGESHIYASLRAFHTACERFWGRRMNSSDLRLYFPSTFDSKRGGHSCNCTFLFTALYRMGLSSEIRGEGKPNSPFYVKLSDLNIL